MSPNAASVVHYATRATPVRARPQSRLMQASEASTSVEFAICALAMVMMIIGFTECGRLIWTFEVLQEAASEGARCMGLRANACASAGVYSPANTTNYVVSLATSRGVTIPASTVALSNVAVCGGTPGFSQVSINYDFTSAAANLLTVFAGGLNVAAAACFPNSS